ncbi:MAG: hypothetical protein P8O16_00440 [Algoriphagus sp.]|uniref:hypothetical protein n=1 Tax=Algoriphagus sp. TaxID=1872435 RepID=UPI00261F21B5|nr:hypothetical protein [Algoriphagus sp.]MDG1275715.1 hypothetical protein [Algoriphagus sp.]
MEKKYSKQQFEGFTHRFIVKMKIDEDWRNDINVTIYSNSDSYLRLENFINEKKSDKVVSFIIEHRASKEQDEISSKFLDEFLSNGGF